MAPPRRRFAWPALLLLVLAHHFIMVTACHEATYGQFIQDFCFTKFRAEMEALRETLWCDFERTLGCYQDLTNCTFLVADKLECFWPNQQVDEFFVAIHKRYFTSCPIAGRVLGDPPNHILCPFILVPTFITLLMTALVMWRSKHGEGII